jgi:hypothetical protein
MLGSKLRLGDTLSILDVNRGELVWSVTTLKSLTLFQNLLFMLHQAS